MGVEQCDLSDTCSSLVMVFFVLLCAGTDDPVLIDAHDCAYCNTVFNVYDVSYG